MTDRDLRNDPDNYCYRHPDRQSFVLCQRCLRTICPECQTQMPVGVVCPECLAEQQKAARVANVKRMPRRISAVAASDSRPLLTYALVAVTSAFYLIGLIPGIGSAVRSALAFNSLLVFPGVAIEPWRIVTVGLVHSGIWHVALNMLALWALGRTLEPMLGRLRFAALYVLSIMGGSALVALVAPGVWVVGASGGVWGLLGALFIIGRKIGANVTPIAIILGLNLVLTFLPGSNISWQAHIGGGLAGLLVGAIFARTRRHDQQRRQAWLLVAVGAGLVAITIGVPPLLYG